MAAPYIHSLIDEKKYSLNPEDTIHIHNYMDSSKIVCGNNKHRVFFHHSFFPYIAHKIFGHTIKNKYDREIDVKDITEKSHILSDFGNQFIPTLSDYFKNFKKVGDKHDILEISKSKIHPYLTQEQINFLKFPFIATGKIESLLLTYNSFWLYDVMPRMFKDYKLKEIEINSTLVTDRLYHHHWINNVKNVKPN